jgi:putative transposase
MPQALTEGEKQRLTGLERRKERQIVQAKKHRGGGFSNRLRRTLRSIAELKARQSNAQDLWISSSGGRAKGVPSRVSDRQVTE